MNSNRRRFSAYVVSLLIIMILLASAFALTYGFASRQLEETSRAVDEAAFREAVAAVETRIALADLVLMSVLRSQSMRYFATQDYGSEAERRIEISRMQRTFRTYFTALPGLVALAVISESGGTIATDFGLFSRAEYWDPHGVDLAETAPVEGIFLPARTVSLGKFDGTWTGDAVTIARGYPVGAAPHLALGGGLLYLDARSLARIFEDLEERTGIVVHVGPAGEASDLVVEGDEFWRSALMIGERSGWIYQGIASQHVGGRAVIFRRVFFYVAIALMVLAATIVTYLDRATRRPFETVIRHIADRLYHVRRETEGGGFNLSLAEIESHVRSVVDQAEQLQSQVALSLPALRWQLIVERLLSPHGGTGTELADATGLSLEGPVFTVLLVVPGHPRASDARETLGAVSEHLVAQSLAQVGPVESVRLMDGTIAAIISSRDQLDADELDRSLGTVFAYDPDAVVAIGKSCDGPEAIYRSYMSARETLEYQIVSPGKRIYAYGTLAVDEVEPLPGMIESTLRDLPPLLHRDSDARLRGWLDDYLDSAQRQAASPTMLKHAVARLILALRAEIRRVHDRTTYPADDLVHEVWATTSLERIREIADEATTLARSEVHEQKAARAGDYRLGNDLAAFVESNFHRTDLSLGLLADSFHISTAHASRVFRATVGQTYLQYVTNHRIKLAERLLTTTDLSVGEIAEQVGYGEVHSLIRSLKKARGVTPAEFRRRNTRRELARSVSESAMASHTSQSSG
ncbi:MAG: helix-turn-helix domain-containing protein [Spirochaetales bacterium]